MPTTPKTFQQLRNELPGVYIVLKEGVYHGMHIMTGSEWAARFVHGELEQGNDRNQYEIWYMPLDWSKASEQMYVRPTTPRLVTKSNVQ